MIVAHISDSHIALPEPEGSDRLGDLARNVEMVNGMSPKADLVIHGGDIAHDAKPEEYRAALDIMQRLDAPFYVIPGNKDRRAPMREYFGAYMGSARDSEFIQYEIDTHSTRIIMLDTLDEGERVAKFGPARFASLQAMLERDDQKPVAIFMHHPPFDVIQAPRPCQYDSMETIEKLSKLLNSHANVIGLYCGHSHRIVESNLGGLPARTITAMAVDLRFGEYPDYPENSPIPGVYVY